MKNLALILVLVMVAAFAQAQDDYYNDEVQTIFSKNRSNGAYGAFTLAYSQIDGQDAFVTGGRGAFIFDHKLAIGIGGYGFVNNLDYHAYIDNNTIEYSLAGGYGGFFVEPIIGGTRSIHLSFPILFGVGAVALIEDYGPNQWEHHAYNDFDHDLFFVIEPAVELEFNLTRWFRTAATLSYRHTSRVELFETSEDVLRGLNMGLTFKFGKF